MNPETGAAIEERVAIIGMAGRFPGARDVAQFWRNLRAGVESIAFFTAAELLDRGVERSVLDDPNYVRANGLLEGVERFDAAFFGLPPREAEITDPQHRLFLECAWTALEHSGYAPGSIDARVGVYAGTGLSSYLLNHLLPNPEFLRGVNPIQVLMGNNKDYMPTRVSYKLDLRGPSLSIGTACSTSLVAVHMACQDLLDYRCDLALAGGAGIHLPQDQGYLYLEDGIVSPDGHCRAFAAGARGTVNGNGVGIVVLKRLQDALAEGDHIHAVIAGSAVNNDGSAKVGYTAPSVGGQAEVIAEALAAAGFSPESIGYVETHGTGTALGDPIEIEALCRAFRAGTRRRGYCALGSVKTNVGHLDEAAGVAGLIKTVLALEHASIPPSLHFDEPNPRIDFSQTPFFVNTRLREWQARPRRAGVSSFGIGGTNAHVVLEEAPPRAEEGSVARPWQLLLWSARTPTALDTMSAELHDYLGTHPGLDLADLGYTLHVGRRAFPHRRMRVCRSVGEADLASKATSGHAFAEPSVAFLFSGQGSQYPQMGRELYRSEPVFREQLDRCAEILEPHLGQDLREVLYPAPGSDSAAALGQTALTQPALFALEYALARLWLDWGIRPKAMLGHSLGEYVAACLAGVLPLEDALALVAARGELIQQLPGGAMLAVPLPEPELRALLGDALSLAAVNGPSSCVASGPIEAVAALREGLAERDIEGIPLRTSHAFHSSMMEPMLSAFRRRLEGIELHAPEIPYLSNLSGNWIRPEEATDPNYWVRHLRQTVRFESGLAQLLRDPGLILLEIGPGRTLTGLATNHPGRSPEQWVLGTLRHPREPGSDSELLLTALGRLWLAGIAIDWRAFHAHERRYRQPLPTYPFEGQRYWIEPPQPSAQTGTEAAPAEGIADWFYLPVWRQAPAPQPGRIPDRWLLLADELGLGERLAQRLRRDARQVVSVRAGTGFACLDDETYVLDPGRREDYAALSEHLRAAGHRPEAVLHLWNLAPPAGAADLLAWTTDRGFWSLLFLVQALAGETPLALSVVSSDMQAVTGTERLRPEQASLLGPVRVIPKEYPQWFCRSIDLAGAWDQPDLIDRLLADCTAEPGDPVLAYRGGERWVQGLDRVHWPAAGFPARLRRGGVYLITGGLGSMGLAFAEYLARRAQARLVLVGREIPPEDEWAYIEGLEAALEQELAIPGLDSYPGLEARLQAFCTSLIAEYLASCGIELRAGSCYDREELRAKLRLVPKFEKFLNRFLGVLAEEGLIAVRDGEIHVLEHERLPEATALAAEIDAVYPQFHGLVALLGHCAGHYPEALSGGMEAIQVLYPDGTSKLLDESGRATAEHANERLYLSLAARLAAGLAGPERKLRILEIGGGEGALTQHVLAALGTEQIEYHFTDLGRAFVVQAEQEATRRGLGFVQFGLFDISQPPEPQGYARNGFDLILGYNVVHATPRIAATLDNLQSLLKPGGLMMLVETVQPRRWNDLIWGLAEGWWYFEDEELRTHSPLLSLEQWEAVLQERGFVDVAGYPRDPQKRKHSAGGLVIARRPGASDLDLAGGLEARPKARMRRLQALRAAGVEVLVVKADVADRAQMNAALALARERFGVVHGAIHAAGVLGQGIVHTKTREQAAQVLAPKLQGTRNLAEALGEPKPDFLVLCSSLSALAPIIGQADYCAANAYLDAFAHYNTRGGVFTIAIDWGFWQELGMIEQAGISSAAKQSVAEEIDRKGWSEAGVEILERILGHCNTPQVIVSPEDVREVLLDSTAQSLAEPSRSAAEPVPHPLFEGRRVEGPKQVSYVSRLCPRRHWLMNEHRVMGKPTLPGTAYLEMVRAAFAHHSGATAMELREVYFLAPLSLAPDEEREVRTVLKALAEGWEFFVLSRLGEDRWLEHARGEIRPLAAPAPVRDIAVLEAAYERRDLRGPASAFGPHWHNVRWVGFGGEEGLALLELPADYAAEVQDYGLHPALLDMATGFMTLQGSLARSLPFSYARLIVRDTLPVRLYSHARRTPARQAGTVSFEVSLLDEQGWERVRAEGYTLREAAAETLAYAERPMAREQRNLGLEIDTPGALDSLSLRTIPRRQPEAGEVEIRIHAAGLNFIEVLYALGMLPRPPGLGRIRLGLEGAGTITAVGEGVEGLRRGDEVMVYAPGCFGLYVTAKARGVALKPPGLSLEEAATLPAAYATGWYALVTQGRLQRGERVLIHAAAGGVGLAGVRIAQWLGAEVFATAGSEAKRDFLRALGIAPVFDSRSLAFADGVLEATGGAGVDVVLNSLGAEFRARSLELLAPYGRFLEIGKRDLFENTRLELRPFLKSLAFFVIDVGPEMPGFGALWQEVVQRLHAGDFGPLPYRVFPLAEAIRAFEHMAQARHIGKIVLSVEDSGALWAQAAAREGETGMPLTAIIGGDEPQRALAPPAAPSQIRQTAYAYERPELTTSYVAPGTPVEQSLAAIWQQLLGIEKIGIHDDFFELRGDSLLAAQVVSRVHKVFEVRLPLSSLFEAPTVAGLAARIDRLRPVAVAGAGEEEEGEI